MKKAFGQTVRDIKRGVNKKVLKVPSIEQKVLDATSNEPWGPHGSLLAEIAQATRNYHEYQMIMAVIWKRTNDTGKNWRHVYKALTVLEYLVAHGSERVIDDIREHAYQISTLSDFQYIDSSGKDQGSNVRKKSQSLVVLVNDKERIQEARQKAASNRDKYRSTAAGSMYRPGSGGYGDRYDDDRYEGRYGSQDDDRNGYGRDDDRDGRYGDSYGREGERYGRDYEDRYGRDGSRDDDYRGRNQNNDDYNYSSRGDRDRNSANGDDGQYSSRESGVKADGHPQDGSTMGERADHKYSDQNPGVPPSYDDTVGAGRSPSYNGRDREFSQPNGPQESVAPEASQGHTITAAAPTPAPAPAPILGPTSTTAPASTYVVQQSSQEADGFDEFDPRGAFSAAPTTSSAPAAAGVEMDLLGSLSDAFSPNPLAVVPVSQPTTASEANGSATFNTGATFEAAPTVSPASNQPFDDPFGDGPFKAFPTDGASFQPQIRTDSFSANLNQNVDVPQPAPPNTAEFGGTFSEALYVSSGHPGIQQPTSAQFPSPELSHPGIQQPTSAQFPSQELSHPGIQQPPSAQFPSQELSTPNQEFDILADILPPSEPSSSINTQASYQAPPNQSLPSSFQAQTGQPAGFPHHGQALPHTGYLPSAESVSQTGFPSQTMPLNSPFQAGQGTQLGFQSQSGGSTPPNMPNPNFYGTYNSQSTHPATGFMVSSGFMVPSGSTGLPTQQSLHPESSMGVPSASQMGAQAPQIQSNSLLAPVSTNPSSTTPATAPQPSKDKFETKSTVWADTLSRGLVNLNISGPKANPMADIGVDFDAINRKEKRLEKQTPPSTVTSTVTMGKAMGSGSGMGRVGASALRAPPNTMIGASPGPPGLTMGMGGGPGMNMGMGGSPGMNMGMGGGPGMGSYGVNQPVGRGMGVGMNMPGNMGMGMGMNMGMGQGLGMQYPMGYTLGSGMPGGYNHMAGPAGFQYPQGGGYR